jgi:polyhydroxyalkanoate synthase subunit PhaC
VGGNLIEVFLTAARKEIERNIERARNGFKLLTGGEFSPPRPTPHDVIWRDGRVELYRYRGESERRVHTPVLAFIGLAGSSHLFDLYRGGSIVELLLERGFDAYVLEWGGAGPSEAEIGLDHYLQRCLPRALEAVCAESGSDDVHLMGYCMGALMAVQALAAQPHLPVRTLVALAAPFDFRCTGVPLEVLRDGRIKIDDVLNEDGNLPGRVVKQSLSYRRPTADLVTYANLWEQLWNVKYVEGYQGLVRFFNDQPDVAGAAVRQVVDQWIMRNGFVENRLRVGTLGADLHEVRTTILAVVAERDDIALVPSTIAIVDVLPNADVELMRLDAGHASLFAGRQAMKQVVPDICEWLAQHSALAS